MIRRLDDKVINQIAAGEVIVRPANAVKEMLENAIDAGATAVEIVANQGGLKQIKITDDGDGIGRDDLAMLCQRFATSKLRQFSDLNSIGTYGFRGEALASISHVARVSVITKTEATSVAAKAYYLDGELATSNFKPSKGGNLIKSVAAPKGTQIIVDDLFYNVPNRLKSLRSKSEELAAIVDVASRYALHWGDKVSIRVLTKDSMIPVLSSRAGAGMGERIKLVSGMIGDTLAIDIGENKPTGLVSVSGHISSPNFVHKKKVSPVIFINNRLVSCDPLRRAVNAVYAQVLPRGSFPIYYLNIHIDPANVDVNMHPTKNEVRFLFEDEIIEEIVQVVSDQLAQVDTARTFAGNQQPVSKRTQVEILDQAVKKYRQDSKLVRVDASQSRITRYLETRPREPAPMVEEEQTTQESVKRKPLELASVHNLRERVLDDVHRGLTQAFANGVYIGVVDPKRRLFCFQYDVKLYLADYATLLRKFYYQIGLTDFGNFGEYELTPPVPLSAILGAVTNDASSCIAKIQPLASMFLQYFKLGIVDGNVTSLPMFLEGIDISPSKLPYFFYRLSQIDYSDEESSLARVVDEISLLYIPEPGDDSAVASINHQLENVIFPELKKRFVATRDLANDVIEMADLPGLYKVFERC